MSAVLTGYQEAHKNAVLMGYHAAHKARVARMHARAAAHEAEKRGQPESAAVPDNRDAERQAAEQARIEAKERAKQRAEEIVRRRQARLQRIIDGEITTLKIKCIVAHAYGLQIADLDNQSRFMEHVRPRQVAMYLCRQCLGISWNRIGQAFGGRDHTTAMHGANKIADLIETDGELAARVAELRAKIEGGER